jgi:hypothetical protein
MRAYGAPALYGWAARGTDRELTSAGRTPHVRRAFRRLTLLRALISDDDQSVFEL